MFKDLKKNINNINLLLLVVILCLVIYVCVNREQFTKYQPAPADKHYILGIGHRGHNVNNRRGPKQGPSFNFKGSASKYGAGNYSGMGKVVGISNNPYNSNANKQYNNTGHQQQNKASGTRGGYINRLNY